MTTLVKEILAHSKNPLDQGASSNFPTTTYPISSSSTIILESDNDPKVVPSQESSGDFFPTILEPSSLEEITPQSLEGLIDEGRDYGTGFSAELQTLFPNEDFLKPAIEVMPKEVGNSLTNTLTIKPTKETISEKPEIVVDISSPFTPTNLIRIFVKKIIGIRAIRNKGRGKFDEDIDKLKKENEKL